MKNALHKATNKGFTLTELMIVIGILGVVMVASVPAIGRFLQNWRLGGDTDQMANTMRAARSTAVMKNLDAVFQFNPVDGTYSYFEDADGDGSKDANEYESSTHEFSPGISFNSHTLPGPQITFQPRGNSIESGTITLANVHGKTKTISLYGGTGNIRVE